MSNPLSWTAPAVRKALTLGLFAAAICLGQAALAVPPAGTSVVFGIHHEEHGDVGEHRVSFSREGEDLVVSVDNLITVEIFFITAFRFQAERREVWRDGRMIAYDSRTHDDGTDILVSARLEGEKLVIDGPEGRIEAPAGTFPTHPWNPAFLGQSLVMDTKTGRLLSIETVDAGRETIEAGGRMIRARKHRITGDTRREIWFDEAGNLVQLRLYTDGKAVTFTLQEIMRPSSSPTLSSTGRL